MEAETREKTEIPKDFFSILTGFCGGSLKTVPKLQGRKGSKDTMTLQWEGMSTQQQTVLRTKERMKEHVSRIFTAGQRLSLGNPL